MEISEIEKFEQQQNDFMQNKLRQLLHRQKQELEVLKKRVKQGRNELILQRTQDWNRLQQHHGNARQEMDARSKRMRSKMTDYIQKYVNLTSYTQFLFYLDLCRRYILTFMHIRVVAITKNHSSKSGFDLSVLMNA